MADKDCCRLLRGDIYMGPPMLVNGKGYNVGVGWGDEWGVAWGGFDQPMQPTGMAAAPASRFVGNSNLSWTPNFIDVPDPVRYSLSINEGCATKILQSIAVTLTAYCHNAENHRIEFGGNSSVSVSPDVVQDELVYPFFGSMIAANTLIPFAKAPLDSTQEVVVYKKNMDSGVVSELVHGVDYEFSIFGIKTTKIVALSDNEIIYASYSSLSGEVMDGYNDCPIDCSLTIEAQNVANKECSGSGQMYAGKIGYFFPRVRLTPTGTRTLFSESEFQAINLEGEALPVWVNGKEVRVREYRI